MKEDSKHIEDKEVRELSLKLHKAKQNQKLLEEWNDLVNQEEAHYVHTVNAFVELIVLYGWDKVVGDLRAAMGEKQW